MTGPPTPPPTTAIELHDAARSSAPLQPAPTESDEGLMPADAEPPQNAPLVDHKRTSYEALFPRVKELAEKGSLHELIVVAEWGDTSAPDDTDNTRMFIIAPLVLAYLTLGDLAVARQALTRLPSNLKHLPISEGLSGLLASAWERKHEVVYTRAEALFILCQQPDFSHEELKSLLAGMITAFVDAYRHKMFSLLAKAYTSISVSMAQAYLGLPPDRLVAAATSIGWTCDASTQILTPPPHTSSRSISDPSTLEAFKDVSNSILRVDA